MNGIDITPIMTSNTEPRPYRAFASTEAAGGYEAYKVFDQGNTQQAYWCGGSTTFPIYVGLDFGSKVFVERVEVDPLKGYPNYCPSSFVIEASNDNINWIEVSDIITVLDKTATISVDIIKEAYYQLYRIKILTSSNSTSETGIAELHFFSGEKVPLNSKLTIHKTLKKDIPTKIDSSKDEIHFTEDGGIYISNNEGSLQKCQTGESGFQMDVLFEGSANTEGSYQLSNRVDSYKFIVIQDAVNEINNTLPAMTSNNSPVPLVATANNEYNQSYQAWKAFDNTRKEIFDCWLTSTIPAYLQIDTGSNTSAKGCYLEPRNDGASATRITIQGSNDEVNWVDLATHADKIPLSGIYIDFNKECTYRYYKLKAEGSFTYCAVAQFKLMTTQAILHHTFLIEANGMHFIRRDDTKALITFEKQTMNIIENQGLKIVKVIGVY